jgi:PEP-CTERM motif
MRADAARVFPGLAIAALLVAAAPARAIPLSLEIYADGVRLDGGIVDQDRLGCVDNPDGVSAHCFVEDLVYGGDYPLLNIDLVDIDIDSDPVVTGTLGVTNLFSTTQQFTFLFTLPITPIPGNTVTGGSFRGTVTDNDGNGATIATGTGSAFYTAQLDGAAWQSLYPAVSSVSAGSFLSSNITPASFGAPIPSLPGPPVASSIGIQLDFSLTAFDSASITSNHVVLPVPEPGTGALLGIGLACLARRRSRLS